jgi:hypothetical protein
MNAKRKGTRNEHRSARLLEAAGYAVTRAAASLGAWDLVAIGSTDIVLVQVKTRDWPGTVESETLELSPVPPGARKLIHRWRDHQRLPDVKELPTHCRPRSARGRPAPLGLGRSPSQDPMGGPQEVVP